jgi:hypothetical protein
MSLGGRRINPNLLARGLAPAWVGGYAGNSWVLANGRPVWVLPLAWGHAMLVLAVRPELDVAVG